MSPWMRRLVREEQTRSLPHRQLDLDPTTITAHMSTKAAEGFIVTQIPFNVDAKFESLVKEATIRAQKEKALGNDEHYPEAFACAPEQMANVLSAIWRRCAETRTISEYSATAKLIPLYKKGNGKDLANYRQIALLPHGRTVIEATTHKRTGQSYHNSPDRLGFQKITGTKIAIARHIAVREVLQNTAV